jgi:hypothetical protein
MQSLIRQQAGENAMSIVSRTNETLDANQREIYRIMSQPVDLDMSLRGASDCTRRATKALVALSSCNKQVAFVTCNNFNGFGLCISGGETLPDSVSFISTRLARDHAPIHPRKPEGVNQLLDSQEQLVFFQLCLKHGYSSDVTNVSSHEIQLLVDFGIHGVTKGGGATVKTAQVGSNTHSSSAMSLTSLLYDSLSTRSYCGGAI